MLSEIKTVNHYDRIAHTVVYKDKLISCSWDRTIKIWDMQEGLENIKLIKTLEGHDDYIDHMVIYKDKLFTGSRDKTIRIWNLNLILKEGGTKPIGILTDHNNFIIKMLVYKDKLISSSRDKTIKIWNLEPELQREDIKCIRTLDCGAINDMLIYKDKLITCSYYSIEIWDLEGEELKHNMLVQNESWVTDMILYKDTLIICTRTGIIEIIDLQGKVFKCIKKLEGHTNWARYITVYKDKLISCSGDKTIRIWDLEGEGENTEPIRIFRNFLYFLYYL